MALTVVFNVLLTPIGILNVSVAVTVCTLAAIAVDGLFAFIIRRLPSAWFDYRHAFFKVSKGERKLYKLLRVKSWRGLVIELGVFTSFSKSRFSEPSNPIYTARFLLESCYGVVIHIACVIVGFGVLPIFPSYALSIGLPVATVNAFLNILPIFVLRYNTPKIRSVHERNLRKAKKELC